MKNEEQIQKTENSAQRNFTRRNFMLKTASVAAGMTIIPRHVLGGKGYKAPSDMVNIAGIGLGNRGGQDLRAIATPEVQGLTAVGYTMLREPYAGITLPQSERTGVPRSFRPVQDPVKYANIYALCDVDSEYAGHILGAYPNAKKYTDFRKMIDGEKEIDGVVIATPDHTHAVIAAYAMAAGKHVYVEKPMTKTIYEARKLAALAKKYNVVTQMGNQGHNLEGTYRTMEWIQSGKIGWVKEVHLSTDRPYWPQGYLTRPFDSKIKVPQNLDYDLWLGPAPEKPYHPDLLHFNWRGLRDYGTGVMGDMGAHTFDAPILALNLDMPTHIQATSTPLSTDYLPKSEVITYRFAARGASPEVTVTWRDGGLKPARPYTMEEGRTMTDALYIGDKGYIMHSNTGGLPSLIPEEPGFAVEPWFERPKNIQVDFIEAIKEGRKANNDFEIASKLTETMLLGNIALVSQTVNTILEYDAKNMRITNLPEANDFFHYEYRKGWEQYLEV